MGRYAEVAQLLTGAPDASVDDGVAWIRETITLLAVPGLAAYGVRADDADRIAADAARSSSMQGNPVPLSHDELRAIVGRAL